MIQLDDIKDLLNQTNEHILSLYLTVDPAVRENQAATPAWRIWLKDALKQIENHQEGDNRALWGNIRSQVEAYFRDYLPQSKGLVLFYGPDFRREYPMPIPVENRAVFGKPLVAPLLWAIDEYEPYLIILVDNEKAHFITAYLGAAGVEDTMALELDTEDWREKTIMPSSTAVEKLVQCHARDDYEQRVEVHIERFYAEVVERAQELMKNQRIRRVILGGNEQSAHAVHRLMPEQDARAVVAILPLPLRYSAHEVLEHILPTALEHERRHEMELVEQIVNLAKAGGRGALGREAVMQALEQQRVELLVAPWPLDDSLDDLPMRVFASGGSLELVHGEAARRLRAEGGLGARLYYAL